MSACWMVTVEGRAYGPYTDAQMTAFAAEGRLAPQSLVSREGESGPHAAAEEPALAHLFVVAAQPNPADPRPAAGFGKNRDDAQKLSEWAQLVVFSDMKSGSISGLEEHIHKLGQAFRLLPQVWLLRTDQSA